MESLLFVFVAIMIGASLVWLGYILGWRSGFNRGESVARDARRDWDMKQFWARQDARTKFFIKNLGLSYMNENGTTTEDDSETLWIN